MLGTQKNGNRWRKPTKRGVSPIIATILLVAITVVLAAVLYVLISGLTKGPGNTPLGSALATSSATESTCKTYCNYTFSVQSASSGVTGTSMKFQLLSSGGSIMTYTNVRLLDVSGCVVGYYTTTSGWTAGNPTLPTGSTLAACTTLTPTSQVSSGDQLILTTTTSAAGAGNTLNVIGTGSYSGTVSASIP